MTFSTVLAKLERGEALTLAERDRYLCARYAQYGAEWCAERLGVSASAVRARAAHLGLEFAAAPGYVRVTWMAAEAGVSAAAARRQVRRAAPDKLRCFRAGGRTVHLVEQRWAEAYIAAWRRFHEGCRGALTLDEAARALGIHPNLLRKAARGLGTLADVVAAYPPVRPPYPSSDHPTRLTPWCVNALRRRLQAQRRTPGMSVRALARELGVQEMRLHHHPAVAALPRRNGVRAGAVVTLVPPAVAERLRKEFHG